MKLLRILLQGSQFMDVVCTLIEADEYITRWQSNELSLKKEKYLAGTDRFGRRWCVLTDDIVGMVHQDLPPEMEQAMRNQAKPQGVVFPQSGRN